MKLIKYFESNFEKSVTLKEFLDKKSKFKIDPFTLPEIEKIKSTLFKSPYFGGLSIVGNTDWWDGLKKLENRIIDPKWKTIGCEVMVGSGAGNKARILKLEDEWFLVTEANKDKNRYQLREPIVDYYICDGLDEVLEFLENIY